MRMLFMDNSSAFNAIVPSKFVIKLETLGLDPALCIWVLDFLTGRAQVVRVSNNLPNVINVQCLAKVFGPLELCDLLPHFRLQT